MKLIIAGSRTLEVDILLLNGLLDQFNLPSSHDLEIVCGMAKGIDLSGKRCAQYIGIPVKEFPADWEKHGKAAGHIRNAEMANYADELLLIWDGESRGSSNMLYKMKQLGKPVYEVILKKHNV